MKFNITNGSMYLFLSLLVFTSCERFLHVDTPKTQIVSEAIFSDDETALAAIRGIYSEISKSNVAFSGGNESITMLAGLSADELELAIPDQTKVPYRDNQLLPSNATILSSIWSPIYKYIYQANSVLEGLRRPNGVSLKFKQQLEGEALFIRAFCHFYLSNIFGKVPVVLSTDYRLNNTIHRSAVEEVYAQIIKDLKDARELLSKDFSFAAGERTRPNYWVATALLARVHLYAKDWEKAEQEASELIDEKTIFSLPDLNKAFLKNSQEAIWQLLPVVPGMNTRDGMTFKPFPGLVVLSAPMLEKFALDDKRQTEWIGSLINIGVRYYFPLKYKVQVNNAALSEYSIVFRLAEQYLIRAEARANQRKISDGRDDLNEVRKRAGLGKSQANNQLTLIRAIEQERAVELFTEWGHRWFDLKRTGRADAVLKPIKATWESGAELYPVPETEIGNNPNLKPQNPGY